jgi:type III secretion system low calcium response chaperone LcrH/SycD
VLVVTLNKVNFMVAEHFSLHDLLDAHQIVKNSDKIEELLSNGKLLQEVMGFSNDLMNEKLRIAQQIYQQQDFEKAKNIYAYLVLLNPYKFIYWMGLAATQMHLSLYQEAVMSYSMAVVVNPNDPNPLYFAAYSYLKLGDEENAFKSLSLAVEIAKKDHRYELLERQSLMLLQKLKHSSNQFRS